MKTNPIYLICSLLLLADNSLAAEFCGTLAQGRIISATAEDASAVIYNNKEYPIYKNGKFLLAFDRDAELEQTVKLQNKDGKTTSYKLNLQAGTWDIQQVKGLPPRKVTPNAEDNQKIAYENGALRTAQQKDSLNPLWQYGFVMPIKGRISGNFGGQRIMNGVKKNPHRGVDIAAPAGTEIMAASNGVVVLAEPNLFYSGNVIVLDHGNSLFTIYAHLAQMLVKKGDMVQKRQIIGTVGQSGRATGPHLHWGATLRGTRFNPLSLMELNKNKEMCFKL